MTASVSENKSVVNSEDIITPSSSPVWLGKKLENVMDYIKTQTAKFKYVLFRN